MKDDKLPNENNWDSDQPDIDKILKAEKKYEWISEPKYKKIFEEIEHSIQGVLGTGQFGIKQFFRQ